MTTTNDITALIERLREAKNGDHERLCQGREYTCTCGYDNRIWAAAIAAADALEALHAKLAAVAETLRIEDALRQQWQARAEKAEEERDKAGELIDADLLARAVKAEALIAWLEKAGVVMPEGYP
jgi:hypothetical protein